MSKRRHSWNFKDLTGYTYGRLTVTDFSHFNNKHKSFWKVKCSCGNATIVEASKLKSSHTRSCGCLNLEHVKTHGMSQTRIYGIWHQMKVRTFLQPNSPLYRIYGGRNITLYPKWVDFEEFYKDMGESYNKHVEEFGEDNTSIDRWPNVDGNYEPGNVRWATNKEQSRNRRIMPETEDYDEHLKWRRRLTDIVNSSLRYHVKNSPLFEHYVRCTPNEFRDYITSLFESWMTWDNKGVLRKNSKKIVWHLDHIKPCHDFDLSKEEDRLVCFNFRNFRPKEALKNITDGNNPNYFAKV